MVEVTLIPDGPLADGSTGKAIVVRKTIGFGQLPDQQHTHRLLQCQRKAGRRQSSKKNEAQLSHRDCFRYVPGRKHIDGNRVF